VSSRVVQLSVTLLLGLLIGVFVGRWTAPSDNTVRPRQAEVPKPASKQELGDLARLAKGVKDAIGNDAGFGLAAVGEILSAASVSDLLDWGSAPENVSRRIINEMSDDELVSTITSITKITPNELGEVSDLRDYANRLSHIGMSGVFTPGLDDNFGHETLEVEFSTRANKASGARDPEQEFAGDTRRIYAVIPNNDASGENLMVHWYRIDQPKIMLFDQYRVSPSDDYSYVYLKSPGEWTSGEYRVEFFSADEHLTPIAAGNYYIREE
jgi:hypothetical protein